MTTPNTARPAAEEALRTFAQEFLDDYRSEDGLNTMKHYAGKAHDALAAESTKAVAVANDPGRDRQIGIGDEGHEPFWQWIRKAYRDPEALDAIFSLWNMQVAFKTGWKQALAALAQPPEAPAAALRDWEITCDDCAGTGKVDHSEPLHVDGRYMGDDLFRIPCNTCLSCGVLVCMADIPKEIQR